MLQLRPSFEHCNMALPPDSLHARFAGAIKGIAPEKRYVSPGIVN